MSIVSAFRTFVIDTKACLKIRGSLINKVRVWFALVISNVLSSSAKEIIPVYAKRWMYNMVNRLFIPTKFMIDGIVYLTRDVISCRIVQPYSENWMRSYLKPRKGDVKERDRIKYSCLEL